MEANDFRIGNYVFIQSDKMVKEEKGKRTQLYRIQTLNSQSVQNYDPIIFNEQWAKSFAFKLAIDNREKTTYELNTLIFTIYVSFSKKDKGTMFFINSKEVDFKLFRYVNDIQNLYFSLTKKELIIYGDKLQIS